MDFEGVNEELYASFIQGLATRLHGIHKTIAVAMPPGNVNALAWRKIGQAVDEVQFMDYDEHWEKTGPGPIASAEYVEKNLGSALHLIPREKLVLGIGIYAARWNGGKYQSGSWENFVLKPGQNQKPKGIDGASFEEGNSTTYYEDVAAVKNTIDIAMRHGIRRIAFWRVGGEDPEIWTEIAQRNRWRFR
jgi:spore germination protein YaaH